jgi:starch synthase
MPVIVFVSRITDQKMADVVAAALPEVIGDAALCVLLGDGERHLEEQFAAAAVRYPGRIAFRVGYAGASARGGWRYLVSSRML